MSETLRPKLHFTPARGWMNGPNGMIRPGELYHLFFQHDPHSINHGPMHWGHAVSVELSELHERLGSTMVYITHDQVEAMTMADQIVVLNRGNIDQVGAPMDLYRAPQTPFVAGFIGSPKMNFMKGPSVKAGQRDRPTFMVSTPRPPRYPEAGRRPRTAPHGVQTPPRPAR